MATEQDLNEWLRRRRATSRAGGRTATIAATVSLTAALTAGLIVGTAPVALASKSAVTTATVGADERQPGSGAAAGTILAHDLRARFRAYLADRPGKVSVALFDARTGATVNVAAPGRTRWKTASTVKLDLLAAILANAGTGGRLSTAQQRLAKSMISVSDNASTSTLWRQLGGTAAMNRFFRQLGMTATTAGAGGKWGLTTTTAADQLAVLRAVAYSNSMLSPAARATVAGLLRQVVPAQRWGLTAGVPAGVTVDLKNGWLPYDGGWLINSLAHVHGGGRDYVMAAYTRDSPSMTAGIKTIEGLSRIAWAAGTVRPS